MMNAAGRLGRCAGLALSLLAAFLIGERIVSLDRSPVDALADNDLTDPYFGQPAAIDEGDHLYHNHCIGCHGLKGGRGPNIFATQLTNEQFLEVVINGRKGTQMPAWGFRLSPDDVWKIRAFLKAHPSGLSL